MTVRVVLSTKTLDAQGSIAIECDKNSQFGRMQRRLSKVRTLDGSSVVQDYGYTDTDRELRLMWTADETITPAVERLVKYFQTLHLSTPAAFLEVAPRGIETRQNVTTLDLYIIDNLTE